MAAHCDAPYAKDNNKKGHFHKYYGYLNMRLSEINLPIRLWNVNRVTTKWGNLNKNQQMKKLWTVK